MTLKEKIKDMIIKQEQIMSDNEQFFLHQRSATIADALYRVLELIEEEEKPSCNKCVHGKSCFHPTDDDEYNSLYCDILEDDIYDLIDYCSEFKKMEE